jgi:outer membrane lipoprotein SlyB
MANTFNHSFSKTDMSREAKRAGAIFAGQKIGGIVGRTIGARFGQAKVGEAIGKMVGGEIGRRCF